MAVVVLVSAILVLLLIGSASLKPLHATGRMTSEKMECNGTFLLWSVLVDAGVRLETPLIREIRESRERERERERERSRMVEGRVVDSRGRLRR